MKKLKKINEALFEPLKKDDLNVYAGGQSGAGTFRYCKEPTDDPQYECGDTRRIHIPDDKTGGYDIVEPNECIHAGNMTSNYGVLLC